MVASQLYPCTINLFHVLVVGPLLIYIGYMREFTPSFLFTSLVVLGLLVIGFHLYRIFSTNRCGLQIK